MTAALVAFVPLVSGWTAKHLGLGQMETTTALTMLLSTATFPFDLLSWPNLSLGSWACLGLAAALLCTGYYFCYIRQPSKDDSLSMSRIYDTDIINNITLFCTRNDIRLDHTIGILNPRHSYYAPVPGASVRFEYDGWDVQVVMHYDERSGGDDNKDRIMCPRMNLTIYGVPKGEKPNTMSFIEYVKRMHEEDMLSKGTLALDVHTAEESSGIMFLYNWCNYKQYHTREERYKAYIETFMGSAVKHVAARSDLFCAPNRQGIRGHYSVLLHGKGGTGKSSMAYALAMYHNHVNIIRVNLRSIAYDISLFYALLRRTNTVFVFDEFDRMYVEVLEFEEKREHKEDSGFNLTPVEMLNIFAGVYSPPGSIFVATTNSLERTQRLFPEEMFRPGRLEPVQVDHMNVEELKDYIGNNFGREEAEKIDMQTNPLCNTVANLYLKQDDLGAFKSHLASIKV